jgi:cytochrome b pre-mRNA-processing protein 3
MGAWIGVGLRYIQRKMLSWLKPSPEKRLAQDIHQTCASVARRPAIYGRGRIPDTFDGRFEAAVLHAALAAGRLKQEPALAQVAQIYIDVFFRSLDAGLREAGVGDLTVPKKMRALAGAVLGRFAAYDAAFDQGGEALAAALARNIVNGEDFPFAGQLSAWMLLTRREFAAGPPERLALAENWPLLAA